MMVQVTLKVLTFMQLTKGHHFIYLIHHGNVKSSDSKGIAYVVTKRLKDGYEWTIKFNQSHQMHEHMVFWFGLPMDKFQ